MEVCDSLKMCKKRKEFVCEYPDFAKMLTPDICPFCGEVWVTPVIAEDVVLTKNMRSKRADKEIKEIINTLKKVDNESTESPYWLILDPQQNMSCGLHELAAQITGPFFSREDAADHLESRRHAFSSRVRVFCHSGYWSEKYKKLCRALNV